MTFSIYSAKGSLVITIIVRTDYRFIVLCSVNELSLHTFHIFCSPITTQHFSTVCYMILVSLPPRNFPACHVKNPVVIKCDFYIDIVFVINVMDLVSYLKN